MLRFIGGEITICFDPRREQKKFAVMTAYDFPSARHCENAGIDMVLVGDSLGMVMLGYDNTCPVSMEEMLHHCRAARRGAPRSFILGDMPYGSYESGHEEALRNAFRFIKEGQVDAVKLEGAGSRISTVRRLVEAGVPVCGHVGLQPQGVNVIGGFRAQGRTADKAMKIVEDAIALQDAGAFAIVIECVPSIVAKAVTDSISIPTIGIGAGPHTTAQVLVFHDMLGINVFDDGAKASCPSFCKMYANVGVSVEMALKEYKADVMRGSFPSPSHDSYDMPAEEMQKFQLKIAGPSRGKKSSDAFETDETTVY